MPQISKAFYPDINLAYVLQCLCTHLYENPESRLTVVDDEIQPSESTTEQGSRSISKMQIFFLKKSEFVFFNPYASIVVT